MMYPKGEKFQYNNFGYVLLAMIIEKVTGMDFDRYLKENIVDRCSMESTGYYGYGMWIIDNPNGRDYAYFQGCDPRVSFMSEYNSNNGLIAVLVSNYGDNDWREMRKIREGLY